MIHKAIDISIMTLGVWVVLSDGFAFGWLRRFLESFFDGFFLFVLWLVGYNPWNSPAMGISDKVQRPLFNCYICMSSFWTLVFTKFSITWQTPLLMLTVCGINYLISKAIIVDREGDID